MLLGLRMGRSFFSALSLAREDHEHQLEYPGAFKKHGLLENCPLHRWFSQLETCFSMGSFLYFSAITAHFVRAFPILLPRNPEDLEPCRPRMKLPLPLWANARSHKKLRLGSNHWSIKVDGRLWLFSDFFIQKKVIYRQLGLFRKTVTLARAKTDDAFEKKSLKRSFRGCCQDLRQALGWDAKRGGRVVPRRKGVFFWEVSPWSPRKKCFPLKFGDSHGLMSFLGWVSSCKFWVSWLSVKILGHFLTFRTNLFQQPVTQLLTPFSSIFSIRWIGPLSDAGSEES